MKEAKTLEEKVACLCKKVQQLICLTQQLKNNQNTIIKTLEKQETT